MTVHRIAAWPAREAPEAAVYKPWMDQARCGETGDFGFFPDEDGKLGGNYTDARKVCATCPVIDECLEDAIRYEWSDPWYRAHGLWGGKAPKERVKIINVRKKAAA